LNHGHDEMVTAVILAAGESARLGTPKQLVEMGGKTLIARTIEVALESRCRKVLVILGAHAHSIRPEVERYDVQVIDNLEWKEGKASSIRAAVDAVLRGSTATSGLLFLACDQPHVSTALLDQLMERFETSGGIPVACEYAGTKGIPAIIPSTQFSELRQLRGDAGAQSILRAMGNTVLTVPFAAGAIDVDEEADVSSIRGLGNV